MTMPMAWQERVGDLREIAEAIRSDDSITDEGIREVIMSLDDAETMDLAAACLDACEGQPNLVSDLRAEIAQLRWGRI